MATSELVYSIFTIPKGLFFFLNITNYWIIKSYIPVHARTLKATIQNVLLNCISALWLPLLQFPVDSFSILLQYLKPCKECPYCPLVYFNRFPIIFILFLNYKTSHFLISHTRAFRLATENSRSYSLLGFRVTERDWTLWFRAILPYP